MSVISRRCTPRFLHALALPAALLLLSGLLAVHPVAAQDGGFFSPDPVPDFPDDDGAAAATTSDARVFRPAYVGMSSQLNFLYAAPRLHGVATTPEGTLAFRSRVEFITFGTDKTSPSGTDRVVLDGIYTRLTPELSFGLAPDMDLTLRIPLALRSGANQVTIGGVLQLDKTGGPGPGEPSIDWRWNLIRPSSSSAFKGVASVFSVKIPMGTTNGMISSGSIDLTGSFAAAFGGDSWRWQFGVGFSYLGPGMFGVNEHNYDSPKNLANVWLIGTSFVLRLVGGPENGPLDSFDTGADAGMQLLLLVQYHFYGPSQAGVVSVFGSPMHDLAAGARLQLGTLDFTLVGGLTVGVHGVDIITSLSVDFLSL